MTMTGRRFPHCPTSGKQSFKSHANVLHGARRMARGLISRGLLVDPIYAYPCGTCRYNHLTRRRYYKGTENEQVLTPAPRDAQLWAMTPEQRARIERAEAAEGRRDIDRLPDPLPEPVERAKQPYANRPKGTRHGHRRK